MLTARNPERVNGGHPHHAFTLIEMLVSVTLVLLMMTLFAGIFQAATTSMSKMKGFAENDQKARLLDTIVRADLVNRSMSKVYPWTPGTLTSDYGALPYESDEVNERRGYFHISEGQPDDDTDDVLQFTTDVEVQRDVRRDQSPYTGKAVQLTQGGSSAAQFDILNAPNQPVFDDQRAVFGFTNAARTVRKLGTDRTMSSPAAEVVYFLRGGVLYRRVLLLRNPPAGASANPSFGAGTEHVTGTYSAANIHPDETTPYSIFLPPSGSTGPASSPLSALTGSGNFLSDFDVSAHFTPNVAPQLQFHGLSSLDSTDAMTLCDPRKRFGFYPQVADANVATHPRMGMPMSVDSGGRFFGRFTHRETSDAGFVYPGGLGAAGVNPYSRVAAGTWQLNRNASLVDTAGVMVAVGADNNVGTADDVALNGSRAGEDILMTNVLGFDVKVLDEDLLPVSYVDLGHAGQDDPLYPYANGDPAGQARKRGYYRHQMNMNPRFGPVDITLTPKGADGEWGRAGVDDDNDGNMDNVTERGWPGSDDPWNRCYDTWSRDPLAIPLLNPGTGAQLFGLPPFRAMDLNVSTYTGADLSRRHWTGTDQRPGRADIDDDGDGIVDNITELWWDVTAPVADEGTGVNADSDDRTPRQIFSQSNRFDFFSESSASRELGPDGSPGNTLLNGGDALIGVPANSFYELTLPDTDDAQPWSQNRNVTVRPLLAIQIRIRYIDPTSNQIRELTLQQRLREQGDDDVGE